MGIARPPGVSAAPPPTAPEPPAIPGGRYGPRPALPRFLQLEPIGRCNLACRMCAVNDRADVAAQVSLRRFDELLDALPGLEQLHLQGLGEPLLHPDFFEMVARATARGVRVSCNSNLTLLTEHRAQRCVDSGLAEIAVSIDGASAQVFEAIRRKASFEKVLRNLRRLVAARDRSGGALLVRGVMVLMRGNYHELPALVTMLHDLGVHELGVQRLARDLERPALPARYIPISDYVALAELREEDLARVSETFDVARDTAARLGVRLHLPRLAPDHDVEDGAPRCTWPWDQMYVTAAGQVLPCCIVGTADVATFGAAWDASPAGRADPLAAWHGTPAQAFRERLATGPPPEVCRGCAIYHHRF